MTFRGTPGQMGNCLKGRQQDQEAVMFHGTYDRADRAERYRKVAAEYAGLSDAATDPFLGSYYLRIAEDYLTRSQGEMRALEREQITALAGSADAPSLQPQPNAP
jgi:hypothetical protein